jgi:hypothetical protein
MENQGELYDFGKLLSELNAADQWLTGMGFRNVDRIRKYQRNIKRMIAAHESGQMEDLQQSMPYDQAREILWSYIEGDEFVRAVSALRGYYDSELRGVLKSVLKGPPDLYLETGKTKQSRDRFFELIMAGRLAAVGYQPHFDRGVDVSFDFATMRVDLECKRPLTESGIEDAIAKGMEQLGRASGEMGFIALSLSRIIVPGDPEAIVTVPRGRVQSYLEQRFSQIIEPARRFWESRNSRRFGGVWFYAFVPVRVDPGPPFYLPCRLERIASTASGALKDIQHLLLSALNAGEKA